MSSHEMETIRELDRELVSIVRGFLILGPLSWSVDVQKEFLAGASRNKLVLPKISYAKNDYSLHIEALKKYITKVGVDAHPAVSFLRKNAESYLDAYYILQGAGTPVVSEFSKKLYGSPDDTLVGYNRKNISIAKYFLRVIKDFKIENSDSGNQYTASQFRELMQAEVEKNINTKLDPINITVDSNVSARAAAGPDYVKLREGATFTDSDLEQLLNHEVMTHTLTYINGRRQPVLSCLGYSAPRVTAIQEGLATFSEYINFSIDLVRLRRIALRIIALRDAENGANFIDIFKFFRKAGQNDEESYLSAMRIFRGGVAEGGVVFYKDNVYLSGLIEVEAFLKRAMHHGKLRQADLIFAGKLTTDDVESFIQLEGDDYVDLPAYLPKWMQKREALAAHLAFNDLTERFKKKI